VKVVEWGEYIAYGDEEVRVGRSFRVFDDEGNLVSTGMEWETEPVKPGEKHEDAIERARRKRLREKIEKIREKYRAGGTRP
jgi:hypothetical protein